MLGSELIHYLAKITELKQGNSIMHMEKNMDQCQALWYLVIVKCCVASKKKKSIIFANEIYSLEISTTSAEHQPPAI